MDREIREMLQSISKDGVKYLAARDVIVKWDFEAKGYTMWVDDEEYGFYSTIKDILPDIKQLQDDRPFYRRDYYEANFR